MNLTFSYTPRGFGLWEFMDFYNAVCSLQESSLADVRAIWFGTGDKRMHLRQNEVKALLPLLQHFAETGTLPPEMPVSAAVLEQQEIAAAMAEFMPPENDDDDGLCGTCREAYEPNGDGYDGECPDCADKTYQAECISRAAPRWAWDAIDDLLTGNLDADAYARAAKAMNLATGDDSILSIAEDADCLNQET